VIFSCNKLFKIVIAIILFMIVLKMDYCAVCGGKCCKLAGCSSFNGIRCTESREAFLGLCNRYPIIVTSGVYGLSTKAPCINSDSPVKDDLESIIIRLNNSEHGFTVKKDGFYFNSKTF